MNSSGALTTGWIKSSTGIYYYMSNDGMLANTWLNDGGTWYYLNSDGAMLTGWQEIDSKYYYFYSSGAMAYDTSIDGYTLNSNGEWVY